MASIEKRCNDTYRLTVSCGYDEKGRKKYKKKTIKIDIKLTQKQLQKELERQKIIFEEEVQKGTYLDGENITFREFALKWFNDYAKKQLAKSTLPNYEVRLKERIIPEIGHLKLSQIQPHHLEGFYNYLSEEGARLDNYYKPNEIVINLLKGVKTSKSNSEIGITSKTFIRIRNGERTDLKTATKICEHFELSLSKSFILEHRQEKLSDKTIKHHHDIISTILSEAKRNNLILSNPAERVRVPKVKKTKPMYYDEIQLNNLFKALETAPKKYKTIIYLTIDSGLRISEIAGLENNHINLENGTLQVTQQRQRVAKEYGSIIVNEPKTENGLRTITLSPTVINILKEYKLYLDECKEKLGDSFIESIYVFRHESGEPMSPSRPYQWFTDFIKQNNLPKLTFHGLRHPYVKHTLKNYSTFY